MRCLAAWALVSWGLGCEHAERGLALCQAQAAIIGGADAGANGAPASIAALSFAESSPCSAAFIAPGVLLTASHCTPGAPPFRAQVSSAGLEWPLREVEVRRHPERDLAVVAGSWSTNGSYSSVVQDSSSLHLHQLATLIGYGVNERGEAGELRKVEEEIVQLDEQWIVVDGRGASGACSGDSGGPLLVEEDGQLRVAGVLSLGSVSCTEKDYYVRVDVLRSWIADAVDGMTTRGGCSGE